MSKMSKRKNKPVFIDGFIDPEDKWPWPFISLGTDLNEDKFEMYDHINHAILDFDVKITKFNNRLCLICEKLQDGSDVPKSNVEKVEKLKAYKREIGRFKREIIDCLRGVTKLKEEITRKRALLDVESWRAHLDAVRAGEIKDKSIVMSGRKPK